MQKQSSRQPMAINKFDADRKRANTPTRISKVRRGEQVAAVVALANSVLAKADAPKPKRGRAPGDRITKLENFDPSSLGNILRARLIAKGRP